MKHLIMGTAGHVDHGKTSLVKSLTGVDCDTHKEEKKRGITINLAFSNLAVSGNETLGIIDVPGHRDFVHTMVGGISGIDFVMLVISADSGIMPQTREHLSIMQILGVKRGLIALNKIDLVKDLDLLDFVSTEIREYVQGTFLATAPIIPVSSLTGEGMEQLRNTICHLYATTPPKEQGELFRLYIDRIFTIKGHGTVVTGSVINGCLHTGENVFLLPSEKNLRVKQMERYGQPVKNVVAGDRASINLAGFERSEYERGMLLCNQVLEATQMIDATISLFESSPALSLWSQVIFHCGTYEAQSHIHLINVNKIEPGSTALVQIKLSKPGVFAYGDRFVIRSSSFDKTLGGGIVIDAYPLHHRRRTDKVIASMEMAASGNIINLIASQVCKSTRAVWANELGGYLGKPVLEIVKAVKECTNDKFLLIDKNIVEGASQEAETVNTDYKQYAFIRISVYDTIRKRILNMIKGFHKKNIFSEKGITIQQLATGLSIEVGSATYLALQFILGQLLKGNILKKETHTYCAFEHEVVIPPEMKFAINFIEKKLRSYNMQTPLLSEILPEAKKNKISEPMVYDTLRCLVSQGTVHFIDDNYIHSEIVVLCREKLVTYLNSHLEGITVAQFRDLVGGNRKICLLLLGHYDAEGLTERDGDLRTLTDKGSV